MKKGCWPRGDRPSSSAEAYTGFMNAAMEEMKFDIIEPGMRVKYVPNHTDLQECVEMGRRIGEAVIAQTQE